MNTGFWTGSMLSVLLVLSASAYADGYRCVEKPADAISKNRAQFAVKLTTMQQIKDKRIIGQGDSAEYVRVEVFSRNPNIPNSRFARLQAPFLGIAKSADVHYQIDTWKTQGFRMGIYMDELDQSWINLRGIRGNIYLNCETTY